MTDRELQKLREDVDHLKAWRAELCDNPIDKLLNATSAKIAKICQAQAAPNDPRIAEVIRETFANLEHAGESK